MKFLIKTIAVFAIGYAFLFLNYAQAQCSEDAPPGSISSNGIQGTILSFSPVPNNSTFALNINIRNTTKYIAHILTVGNFRLSSNSGAEINRSDSASPGLNICRRDATDKGNPDACLKSEGSDINAFNEIPACGSIRGTFYYFVANNVKLMPGDNVLNYTYKAIVRFSSADSDPLLADKPASPPRIVTLAFPPVPIR